MVHLYIIVALDESFFVAPENNDHAIIQPKFK